MVRIRELSPWRLGHRHPGLQWSCWSFWRSSRWSPLQWVEAIQSPNRTLGVRKMTSLEMVLTMARVDRKLERRASEGDRWLLGVGTSSGWF